MVLTIKVAVRALIAFGAAVWAIGAHAVNGGTVIGNPDWEIVIGAWGYSDQLLDRRPGFEGREYLSGEWGAAVAYSKGDQVFQPLWLDPEFIFPDWFTHSNFFTGEQSNPMPVQDVMNTGMMNDDGFFIYESIIENFDLRITQHYQMIDTGTGIDQGASPASSLGPGVSVVTNRYVLRQDYWIENISGQAINDLNLYQFLHGFQSENAVFDDTDYDPPQPYRVYHYDVTQQGTSSVLVDLDQDENGVIVATQDPDPLADLISEVVGEPFDAVTFAQGLLDADAATVRAELLALHALMSDIAAQIPEAFDELVQNIVDGDVIYEHDDVIAFHSDDAPVAWEVGAYGVSPEDCHVSDCGKPGTGVHLSIEGDALDGTDAYFPASLWVSGAQKYDLLALNELLSLGDGESVHFDVLLSISTETRLIPVPAAVYLFVSALGLLGWLRRSAI